MIPTASVIAVGLYAAASTFVLIWLSLSIARLRGELKVFIGDGGEVRLIRAMRGQANFTENVPVALILLLLMALFGTPAWVIHIFGLALVFGRVIHAAHFIAADAPGWQRMWGSVLTVGVQAVAALGLIAHGLVLLAGQS